MPPGGLSIVWDPPIFTAIMVKRQKRVLLALGWYDYHLHQGIEKFARENGWHLYANLAREKVIPWGWEGDGVLAWLGAGDDLAEFVQSIKKPTVDFSLRRPQLKFPRVLEDHTHAAQLVAEHFLSRGFVHFAFFSDTDKDVTTQRIRKRRYVFEQLLFVVVSTAIYLSLVVDSFSFRPSLFHEPFDVSKSDLFEGNVDHGVLASGAFVSW